MASVFESEFDAYRQNAWNQYASIHDNIWAAINNHTITAEQLQLAISRLSNLMTAYRQYYDSVRALVGAEWIDPRFHDFYDPMQRTLIEWNNRLAQIPQVSVTQPSLITTPLTNGILPSFLNIPGFGPSAPSVPTNGKAYTPEWMGDQTVDGQVKSQTNWIPWVIGAGILFLLMRK